MENKLKNPVWYSLNETHQQYIVEFDKVKFYNPNICPFGAFTNTQKTASALNEYAKLTDSFFLVSENENPTYDSSKVQLDKKIEGVQMVLQNLQEVEFTEEIIPLTENHLDEIYDLIWLVMPGYYRKRTFDMGKYFGIFKNNQLVSIAGQRMQTNDFIEVSGVVTHPEFTKRGFAKQLTQYVTKDIIADGKHPILHTTKGNPAIKLYENLGYQITRDMNWWYFHKK